MYFLYDYRHYLLLLISSYFKVIVSMAILLSDAFSGAIDHFTGMTRVQIQLAAILFFSSRRVTVMLHGFIFAPYLNRNVFFTHAVIFSLIASSARLSTKSFTLTSSGSLIPAWSFRFQTQAPDQGHPPLQKRRMPCCPPIEIPPESEMLPAVSMSCCQEPYLNVFKVMPVSLLHVPTQSFP